MQKLRQYPILILLIVNLLIGALTFRDYGLSWDEPLFYDYANALTYAYSPSEWFSGNFNLENAFGPSGSDHANRGPAYVILARPLVSLAESFGADNASAWHLINFLTFQLGVYLLYRLASRWVNKYAALCAAALFAWQPLFWGHAFINPKDPPFLVFFLGAMCFGLEMIDEIFENTKTKYLKIFLAAFFLGIASSIRVLGPLAGGLVGLYALTKVSKNNIPAWLKYVAAYAAASILIAFIAWPYLWNDPLQTFVQVFGFMSDNPTDLQVLFHGKVYTAGEVPFRYLPFFLIATLTEPVWILFLAGAALGFWKSNWRQRFALGIILLWFLVPISYVLLRRPSMYDGFRHFFFISTPFFLFSSFAFEKILNWIKGFWSKTALIAAILLAGLIPAVRLHPYEYAYYNSFVGGADGAFRAYETEFWLTCYKESMEQFNVADAQLFVKREPYIAKYYAKDNIVIRDYRTEFNQIQSGDYVLVNTRTNEDLKTFHDAPIVVQIQRGNAIFCEIKKIP